MLSNSICNTIVNKTIARQYGIYPFKPLSPYRLNNTNKNEASGASVQSIYMVERSIDNSFCELSDVICFVIELLTRAEIL